ncbi:MAG: hypothetical protein CSB03_00185 [Bacteroidia bacterium]|nr:MAG: hypothetical protein CSB03_00185 [Bacteroidia bacterium]
MKKIYLLFFVLLTAFAAQAQTSNQKGDLFLNAGVGIGTYGATNLSIPPITVSADYTLKDKLFDEYSSLSAGAYLGYYGTSSSYGAFSSRWSNFLLGGRGAVHYSFVDKLDTYAGLMLGYDIVSYTTKGELRSVNLNDSSSNGNFIFSAFVGARYFFTETIGAYAEIGYGLSALELGVSFKF